MKLNRLNTLVAVLVVGATTGLSLPHARAGLVESRLSATSNAHVSTAERETTKVKARDTYGKLPLSFEANLGQTDERVSFVSRGSGYALFLTPTEAVLSLRKVKSEPSEPKAKAHEVEKARGTVVRMFLGGANPNPKVSGVDELPGRVNYLKGNDPKQWRTKIPTYAKVKYHEMYPGVDLVYYGNQRQLEYDFIVAPDGDPRVITLSFEGADRLEIDANGDLVLNTTEGQIRQHHPIIYQKIDGERRPIPGSYVIKDTFQVGFQVAAYDRSLPLVIDPVMALGDTAFDSGLGIAVDNAGSSYVTGRTSSFDFPIALAPQPNFGGDFNDAFVAKLSPDGLVLEYSTYLGGSKFDYGAGISVDASGNAYVTGFTDSSDFPTANPLQPTFGGTRDAFVAKLSADGSVLIYSTYLGGWGFDEGAAIAVDISGNAYVTGRTASLAGGFPTVNPLQPSFGGGQLDVFVAKLNSTGSALVYSTYLGGNGYDEGRGIAVDFAGNALVTGETRSTNFPTVNPLQPMLHGFSDAFVAQLNPTGSALAFSTYLGGSGADFGTAIATDSVSNMYVTGRAVSTDFPTANPFQANLRGPSDAFVVKLNPFGVEFVYSTYLGGSNNDEGFGIAADSSGNAFVIGQTFSFDLPTLNASQPNYAGGIDAFVTKLNPAGSALIYSTYLGGSGSDEARGIAIDSTGNAYITGGTNSFNFPTVSSIQSTLGGVGDAFVAKLNAHGSGIVYSTYLGGSNENNRSPIANAGPDQTASAGNACQATVTLNGTASFDPDGDSLSYTWMGLFGTISGPTPAVPMPLGTNLVSLIVVDGRGGVAGDGVTVIVQDHTPPVLSNVPGPIVVEQSGVPGTPVQLPLPTATDNCGSVRVTSDAPFLFPLGTTTIRFTAMDHSGNTAFATTTVTVIHTNKSPIANAGPDQTVECSSHLGAQVALNGTALDPENDPLIYTWTGPFGTVTGPAPVVTVPRGTHVISLQVNDGNGGTNTDTLTVTVQDTTVPSTFFVADPWIIQTPNHQMIPITVDTSLVTDVCDPRPTCKIISVVSNEPEDGLGDGDTVPDWEIDGTLSLKLRAERSGNGTGRRYEVTGVCTDASGNSQPNGFLVVVPR